MRPEGKFDVAVVGGGLAGLAAASRLAELGVRCLLVDRGLPQATGQLGGFAKFSGAKFSLPPAGMGLLPVAGSRSRLLATIYRVLDFLGLEDRQGQSSDDLLQDDPEATQEGLRLRSYRSIVVQPSRMDALIEHVTRQLDGRVALCKAGCRGFAPHADGWLLDLENGVQARCAAVFCAGGRSGANLLAAAGASAVAGKGVDLGVRVEFPNKKGLAGLRALGPDAKLLVGSCRTFCLNVPGQVYRYQFEHLLLPGGVIAEPQHPAGNVGLLRRVADKEGSIRAILRASDRLDPSTYCDPPVVTGARLGAARDATVRFYGEAIASELQAFAEHLGSLDLVDWDMPHKVHLPLLDWHWPVYARPGSFATDLPGVYALGDSSGHARGLLQAAVSGWLAAEEYAL